MKTLPVFVSLVSLAFAVDGFAQTPAQGPIQLAQAAGGASPGAGAPAAAGSGVTSTIAAVVAIGVAGVVGVATSNTTTSASNH